MGKCKRVLRCYHCGSVLQTKDPKEKGFITESKVGGDLTTNRILYCDRCFDVIHSFNNSALDLQIDQDILRVLDDAVATDALIVWVIDLFAFNGALNPEIAKKVKKLKVVVVTAPVISPINEENPNLQESNNNLTLGALNLKSIVQLFLKKCIAQIELDKNVQIAVARAAPPNPILKVNINK